MRAMFHQKLPVPRKSAALALVLLMASASGHAASQTASQTRVQVRCAEDRSLSLRIEKDRAIATFEGRRLVLPRQPFPLGEYYRSGEGALIIDGSFVAFVPTDDPTWRQCEIKAGG